MIGRVLIVAALLCVAALALSNVYFSHQRAQIVYSFACNHDVAPACERVGKWPWQ